ncbi:MAG: DinB family protein [Gemmatimonadaceae bacterium]|nr:DinB family protein [Gemmatimonadaceae bacterium]
MTIDTIRFFRGELRRSLHGPAWHGPALLEALGDVTVSEAFHRPESGAHSIAELAVHAVAWMEEVERRLGGSEPAEPERGDWPSPGKRSQANWDALRALVEATGNSLDARMASFKSEHLLDKVGSGIHNAPLGSGVPYIVMLNGVIQHNVYHAGQVVLLKKEQRA